MEFAAQSRRILRVELREVTDGRFFSTGSGETLEIRDIRKWRAEQVQIEEVWGSLVCVVAEVVIIGENLKNKHANLWPLSWTEARVAEGKSWSSMSSKRELRVAVDCRQLLGEGTRREY